MHPKISPVRFFLNGERVVATDCRPDQTVLDWLRGSGFCGTKEGCAEGDCGACSVLVSHNNQQWEAINSCILVLGQIDGCSLLTIEGLGSEMNELQRRMSENGSSQCGFCTPGIVMSLSSLLGNMNRAPKESEVHDALAGNLCRCTGYRPIVEAACSSRPLELPPPSNPPRTSGAVGDSSCVFYQPRNLSELVRLRRRHKKAVLVGGGTDLNIDVAHGRTDWDIILSTRRVDALRTIAEKNGELVIGGAVTWQESLPFVERHWSSFGEIVRRFGSPQIRSSGTVAGNLATASPIGDGSVCLLALDASVTLVGSRARRAITRRVSLRDFFVGYRRSVLRSDEIIRSIHIPLPRSNERLFAYKISKRYDQDISTVMGAIWVRPSEGTEEIEDVRVAFGGLSDRPERCYSAERLMVGRILSSDSFDSARDAVKNHFSPLSDLRGSSSYRLLVASNLFSRLSSSGSSSAKSPDCVMDFEV